MTQLHANEGAQTDNGTPLVRDLWDHLIINIFKYQISFIFMQNLIFDWCFFVFSDCNDFIDPVDYICLLILF